MANTMFKRNLKLGQSFLSSDGVAAVQKGGCVALSSLFFFSKIIPALMVS